MQRRVAYLLAMAGMIILCGRAAAELSETAAPLPDAADFDAPPDFVETVEPVAPEDAVFDSYGAVRYLLVDSQHDSRQPEPASYFRTVKQALNVTGVESIAQTEIEFDPSHQRLVFHHIRIVRDGETIDRRDATQIEFARRETDSARLMFNGDATAMVRIRDIRVGDVLDIAYTTYGRDPVYGEYGFRDFRLNWSVPVERRSVRSLWQAGSARFWDLSDDSVALEHSVSGDTEIFRIAGDARDAINFETGAPDWYIQQPMLRISGYADWQEVAAWATPLFEVEPDAAVQAIADRIAAEHAEPDRQLIAALRFVQNEIRYLALTYGEGSYTPAPPAATLENRYGDCKAKTVLLIALARALGIEADAALVSLGLGHGVDRFAPSPGAFNHVIVRLRLDGETYWFDPTASHQGGSLRHAVQASYGWALPLDGSDAGLVAMPELPRPERPWFSVHEVLDISGGRYEPVYLTVTTTYTGPEADSQRARIASQGRTGLQRAYLDFYNRNFGDTDFLEPMEIDDDPERNIIVTREQVELANPYEDGEEAEDYIINFFAHGIGTLVESSSDRRRDTPLAIGFPTHSRHIVDLRLTNNGEGWTLENSDETIENDAFLYRARTWHRGAGYRLQYDLEARARTVEPGAAMEVLREHEDMRNDTYYGFDMIQPVAPGSEDLP